MFRSIGHAPIWFTFSGGEPFLRRDLTDIVIEAVKACRPAIVNIPTNGWFVEQVVDGAKRITAADPDVQLVLNLSIDHHVPHRHDEIRVKEGSWDKLMETYGALRALRLPNLTVGVHTVVSTDNQHDFPDVAHGLRQLGADSYICEPAEERVELQTIGLDITPRAELFRRAARSVLEVDDAAASGLVARIAKGIRTEYYSRVANLIGGDLGAMPVCHAGFISAHIGADGDVWPCCVLARPLGNVRAEGFDFRKVWASEGAERFRDEMRRGRCTCPLANAAYTNLLLEPTTVAKVAGEVLGIRRRNGSRAPVGASDATS